MRLSALRLDNFRSYKESVNFEGLRPITVLIGPNNAGKSNFIQALSWYRGMERGEQPGVRDFIHSGNRSKPLVLDLEFELDDRERRSLLVSALSKSRNPDSELRAAMLLRKIRHELEFDTEGLRGETLSISNSSGDWLPLLGSTLKDNQLQVWRVGLAAQIAKAPAGEEVAPGERRVVVTSGRTPVGFQWNMESRSFEEQVATHLRGYIRRWQVIPPYRQMSPRISPGQELSVQQGGGNLVRVLNAMQTEDPDRFVSLTRDIYKIVPGLTRITAPPRGNEVTTVIREPGDVEIEAKDASTGLQQILILVTSLLTFPRNTLIAIEEPEIHLHASSQRALLDLVKRLARDEGQQFVITTHSTIFAQTGDDIGTMLVEKRSGSSIARQLRESPELHDLKRILGHENSDLFGFNAVLVIEGDTEESALPILAESIGLDFARSGIKLVNIRGAGKTTRFEELLRYLKDSDTIPFVMLDNLPAVRGAVDDWIREGLVKPVNVFIWEKEFEDCFENSTVVTAFNEWARDEKLSISLRVEDLDRARRDSTVSNYLGRFVFEKAGRAVSKPGFGEKIARVLTSQATRPQKTPPEQALEKIREAVVR